MKQIQEEKDASIMYIGDSGTDLLPLLNVDSHVPLKAQELLKYLINLVYEII